MNTASDPRFELELPSLPRAKRKASVAELYQHGFAAEGVGRLNLAASYFEEVRRRQPNNPYVLLDLARVYFQLIEIDRAKSVLHEAAQRSGQDSEFWHEMALVYQEARLDSDATRCFLQACSHDAHNVALSAALIAFYESRGDLKQAQAALKCAPRSGAKNGLITALEGIVLLRTGDYSAAIEALTASLTELPQRHSYHINARYALARALAETGEEAASLKRLREAKVLQQERPEAQRHTQIGQAVMKFRTEARAAIESTDVRAHWRATVGPRPRPLVFLLGYPRSGTTLLEQVLESHSAIHSFEETGAFIQASHKAFGRPLLRGERPWDVINTADPAACQRARQWYFEYLNRLGAPRDPSTLLLDKNPGLTGHVHIIARLFPEAKFLVMVRDPRDICLSAYQTQVVVSPFSVNWLSWPSTVKHCVHILQHWVAVRDRLPNPYLEVRYEDLIADLPGTGRRIMEFLDLEWEPQQADFAQHARSKQVYSPTVYDVRQAVTSQARGKWRRFPVDYAAGQPGLSLLLQQYGYETAPEQNGQSAAASRAIGTAADGSAKIADPKANLLA